MSGERVLLVSPVRNEAAHLERVAAAIAAQTRPPECWVVVDDGSTDGTREALDRLAGEIGFMRVVSTPAGYTRGTSDRLAVAAPPRAFNFGLHSLDTSPFTHIGKLDGDVELLPDYFETLLEEFALNPRLGIGGGTIFERRGGEWRAAASAQRHVRGALKLYTRECFEAIGGVTERLGWDGIDETLARMRGFETWSFDHAKALHHRDTGSADGRLRGHARWGEAHWMLQHGLLWTTLRAAKVAREKPRGAAGIAYLYGYARAALRGVPRVDIEGYREFVRADQRRRIFRRLPQTLARNQSPSVHGG
jgi:hypothetical protein